MNVCDTINILSKVLGEYSFLMLIAIISRRPKTFGQYCIY